MEENREIIERPQNKNLTPGGPGRPKGRRNFTTIFYDALEKLAEKNGIPADQLETEIVEKALLSARKGDHKFYKDLMDRLHGQATQKTDVTSGGEKIKIVFDTSFNATTPETSSNQ